MFEHVHQHWNANSERASCCATCQHGGQTVQTCCPTLLVRFVTCFTCKRTQNILVLNPANTFVTQTNRQQRMPTHEWRFIIPTENPRKILTDNPRKTTGPTGPTGFSTRDGNYTFLVRP